MWNRREMLTRLAQCRRAGVPICNYGMTIAYTLGIFDRALVPFPDALETYRNAKNLPSLLGEGQGRGRRFAAEYSGRSRQGPNPPGDRV